MEKLKNYIGGELVEPISRTYLDNYDPARGEIYSQTPDSDEEDVDRAVECASAALASWARTSAQERSGVLRKIARIIDSRAEELARAESVDTGKPVTLAAQMDIPRSAANLDFFADAITQFSSESHSMGKTAINYTLRDPVGVVGCVSPWNLPLYLLTWKVAPALAAGNCVVAKPSEVTPMTAALFSKICIEAGLPPGVLNIVHGLGRKAGSAISANPTVRAVSFTGSTRTGAEIAKTAAESFKKVSLEMGGKNPALVFSDCDLEQAVQSILRSSFLNQGQVCLCTSRIFVQRPIYNNFKSALMEKLKGLKIGDPLDPATQQGAVVSREHFDKVRSCIALAENEGGKILTGGKPVRLEGRCEKGWFIEPTLVEGLSPQCQTNREEIFGPVATLIPFEDEAEVLGWANDTRYGLAATLWTRDLSRAHRLAGDLHAGVVWVNCWLLRDLRTPFGGMKDSGLGREGGIEALKFFTEPKNVCIQLADEPKGSKQ